MKRGGRRRPGVDCNPSSPGPGPHERVELALTVTVLIRPEEFEIAQEYGIIATGRDPAERVDVPLAEIEVKATSPSGRMVRDYAHWCYNWR